MTDTNTAVSTKPIPLFMGTSATPYLDGISSGPLMTLVETLPDNDERQFNIQMGAAIIGILGLRPNNSYDLRWLLTGGCLSGQGTADLDSDTGRASIAAHIFELLAHDLRTYITESSEERPDPFEGTNYGSSTYSLSEEVK